MDNQNPPPAIEPQPVPVSPPQPQVTPVWAIVVLFFIFPPIALFIILKQRIHHKLLPVFLWIYAGLILMTYGIVGSSLLPRLQDLYKSVDKPYPPTISYVVWGVIVIMIIQVIFGFTILNIIRRGEALSKNFLIVAALFFMVDMAAPVFMVFGVISPIYNLVSDPEISSIPQTISVTPSAEPTGNWKTYQNEQLGFNFKYPTSLSGPFETPEGIAFGDVTIIHIKTAQSKFIKPQNLKPCTSFTDYQLGCLGELSDEQKNVNGTIKQTILDGKPAQSFYYSAGDNYHHVIQTQTAPKVELQIRVGFEAENTIVSSFKFTN